MCIVSIKRLLQQQTDAEGTRDIVVSLGKMLLRDKVTAPQARAAVMWLISEHAESVPKIAPDVFRLGAKNFVQAVCVRPLGADACFKAPLHHGVSVCSS